MGLTREQIEHVEYWWKKNGDMDNPWRHLSKSRRWLKKQLHKYMRLQNKKIDDDDILNAIRYHTTGRKNMSLLEKIVYNADCISIDRKFEGIEYFRKVAMVDLNVVIIDKTSKAMQTSLRKQKPILIDTLEAYNDLVDKI